MPGTAKSARAAPVAHAMSVQEALLVAPAVAAAPQAGQAEQVLAEAVDRAMVMNAPAAVLAHGTNGPVDTALAAQAVAAPKADRLARVLAEAPAMAMSALVPLARAKNEQVAARTALLEADPKVVLLGQAVEGPNAPTTAKQAHVANGLGVPAKGDVHNGPLPQRAALCAIPKRGQNAQLASAPANARRKPFAMASAPDLHAQNAAFASVMPAPNVMWAVDRTAPANAANVPKKKVLAMAAYA